MQAYLIFLSNSGKYKLVQESDISRCLRCEFKHVLACVCEVFALKSQA